MSTERMTADASGRVDIDSPPPARQLHVVGDVSLGTTQPTDMGYLLTRRELTAKIAKVQQAKAEHVQRHSHLTAAREECVAQINALIGREAELTELLALVNAPKAPPHGD